MIKSNYFDLLKSIISYGTLQDYKKGSAYCLLNEQLFFSQDDIIKFIDNYKLPKILLERELNLYMIGAEEVEIYKQAGIVWWNYCAPSIINSYPKYYSKLAPLIDKINKEKSNSKNYIFHIGKTDEKSSQHPCLSLMQFQIILNRLHITVYQRSADCNLGLPCDIYQVYLISQKINVLLKDITFFIGNAHIYDNNIEETKKLLNNEPYKFILNV